VITRRFGVAIPVRSAFATLDTKAGSGALDLKTIHFFSSLVEVENAARSSATSNSCDLTL
jgi:hypothetical protein